MFHDNDQGCPRQPWLGRLVVFGIAIGIGILAWLYIFPRNNAAHQSAQITHQSAQQNNDHLDNDLPPHNDLPPRQTGPIGGRSDIDVAPVKPILSPELENWKPKTDDEWNLIDRCQKLEAMIQEAARQKSAHTPVTTPRPLPKFGPVCKPIVPIYLAKECAIFFKQAGHIRERLTPEQYKKLDPLWYVPRSVRYDVSGHADYLVLEQLYITNMEDIDGFTIETRTDGRMYESATGERVMVMKIGNEQILGPLDGGKLQKLMHDRKNRKTP